jgi:hypothetical protein
MKKIAVILSICASVAGAETLPEIAQCRYENQIERLPNGTTKTYQKEVCTEESSITIQTVRIGQLVRLNQLRPHPVIQNEFAYKQNRCRWFSEASTAQKDLVQFQGIACEVQPNVWKVVDKF